jgi:hypothetical protein
MMSRLNNRLVGSVYSALRSALGLLIAADGAGGLVARHSSTLGSWPVALFELLAGLLIAFGLCTRVAAVVCLAAMPAQFSWVLPLVLLFGSGPVSVDAWLRQRRGPVVPAAAQAKGHTACRGGV